LSALIATTLVVLFASVGAAQTLPGSADWQPAADASGDDTYVGAIDTPANGAVLPIDRLATVSGWFVDTTAQGWAGADDVEIFAGTMDSGTLLTHGSVGLSRNDLVTVTNDPDSASAGWSATIDPGTLPSGSSTISVYLHTPAKGWWFTQVSVTLGPSRGGLSGPPISAGGPLIEVAAPQPNEKVSIHLGNYRITGSVRDPVGGPRAIDWVEVWLSGERETDTATFLGLANLQTDGTWELDFTPANYPALTSNLYVYAHSGLTNKTGLLVVHFELDNRRP
jgi:hypothetical protein